MLNKTFLDSPGEILNTAYTMGRRQGIKTHKCNPPLKQAFKTTPNAGADSNALGEALRKSKHKTAVMFLNTL